MTLPCYLSIFLKISVIIETTKQYFVRKKSKTIELKYHRMCDLLTRQRNADGGVRILSQNDS